MYKTPSGRFIAIRNKPRLVSAKAETTPTPLSRTPEELESTPMKGSSTLKALDKHQHAIRKLHQAFLKSNDPHVKKLIGSARDRLLSKVTHEDNFYGFVASLIRFNNALVESDEEMRRLERRRKAEPNDEASFIRHSLALKRAGRPMPKTPGEMKARGRLATIKKFERRSKQANPPRMRDRGGIGRHANATTFALAKYHASARLGMERAKRGMKMADNQDQANSFRDAHDRYKRALGHIKNAKAVNRGNRITPGNLQSHLQAAHDNLRVAHELSGLQKRRTGKKYFPNTEF